MRSSCWDVVVVGAGPAGSVSAWALSRAGASVLLVDRQSFPRWKVCGACIGPAARKAMASAGLFPSALERAVELRRLRLNGLGRRADIPLAGNAALSRSAFDASLVDEAIGAGVSFLDGARASITEVSSGEVELTLSRSGGPPETTASRLVVDATGLAGTLERNRDERADVASRSRVGLGALFPASAIELAPGDLSMVVGRFGYVGLVRLEDGTIDVGAAVDAEHLAAEGPSGAVEAILAEAGAPPLRGTPVEAWRGTPPLTRRARAFATRRVLRVGDATGYLEPFTGEGIGWAIRSALDLAPLARRAVDSWSDEIGATWTRVSRRRLARNQRTCAFLARGLRRPGLVRTSVGVLGAFPGLAGPLVRATGGANAS